MDITKLSVHRLRELLDKKEISSVEAAEAYLARIEEAEPRVNAYITVTRDAALEAARGADKAIASGSAGPLTGVPMGVKDIFCTRGIKTTCASRMLGEFVPPYESTVTAKLREAGAVILGKNNMDEFAMGSSTENSAFGVTKNPWDTDRVPGGSSGGSAAAVAARECAASVGTDTGGSIRQPGALCGVVGMKPTYGRVSRFGMIAFASSLDQAGPLTRDVRDAATLLGTMAGHDPKDSTSRDAPVPDFTEGLEGGVKGLRVGIPGEFFAEGLDPEVEEKVRAAIKALEDEGADVVEVTLPHNEYAVSIYYLVATAEASSNLARYDGVRYGYRTEGAGNLMEMYTRTRDEGFGAEVKRRVMLGTYSLSAGYYDAYYRKASQVRTLVKKDFETAFEKCDVIATPTSPTAAFKIGEKIEDPLTMYLSDIYTISCNLAGNPGISIPCGYTSGGLPVGFQLMGRHLDEATILRAAYACEQALAVEKRDTKV